MRPSGIKLEIGSTGPRLRVTESNQATDAIWDAVRKAREAGFSVEDFRRESAESWAQDQQDEMKSDEKAWR